MRINRTAVSQVPFHKWIASSTACYNLLTSRAIFLYCPISHQNAGTFGDSPSRPSQSRVVTGSLVLRELKTNLVCIVSRISAKVIPSMPRPYYHTSIPSLSYYYAGLSDKELFMTFYHLLKSDQADQEFQAWVKDAPGLADEFRHLTGINLKDETQCVQEVFPSLRLAKSLVDYYLAHLVFPKEIKEFPQKLSASGWDLGRRKTGYSLNGFSGTNDLQKVLPFDMEHLDLHEQKHTNALVLSYLLHRKNTVEILPASENTTSDAHAILKMVVALQPSIQVVIDVGSLIIDLSNIDVARAWLELSPKSQAVVYFDDHNDLFVIDRCGRIESFLISPFAKQLDVCLVYLDESHCHGIDLRLPENSRAAVTLGPALVKDTLVQACMRMRQMDKG